MLFGVMTVAAGPIWTAHARPDAAHAANCTWHRHSRRVVRQVKRGGRDRRIGRTRHWWTCDPAPAQPPVPDSTPAPPSPAPDPDPGPAPARLSVQAEEYSYTLSRPSVPAGDVIVELDNRGEDPHNLNLQPVGTDSPPLQISKIESQEQGTARFTLPAGTYRLWCSLPEHDQMGMHATLTVGDG
jgi:plastocyanin